MVQSLNQVWFYLYNMVLLTQYLIAPYFRLLYFNHVIIGSEISWDSKSDSYKKPNKIKKLRIRLP